MRVVRDGKVCDGDVSFLSPLRDTCTITYVDKTVETFVSVKRLRSASRDGGFAVLAAPPTAGRRSRSCGLERRPRRGAAGQDLGEAHGAQLRGDGARDGRFNIGGPLGQRGVPPVGR